MSRKPLNSACEFFYSEEDGAARAAATTLAPLSDIRVYRRRYILHCHKKRTLPPPPLVRRLNGPKRCRRGRDVSPQASKWCLVLSLGALNCVLNIVFALEP